MTEDQALELVNISRSLMLNLPEFPLLVEYYNLPKPNLLSPLPDLCSAKVDGIPRDIEKIVEETSGAADEAVQLALTPIATPDRILDVRLAVFNSAPQLTRLYAAHPVEGQMVALAPHLEFDHELIFPFSYDDLLVWMRMQLQYSSSMTFPIHQTDYSGEELAFLLALADAYKAAYVRSFQPRRQEPEPVVITADDILDAQKDALEIRDRRWLLHAIGEFFNEMIHIGGKSDVNLPKLTKSFVKQELERYKKNEDLLPVEGKKAQFQLGPSLEAFIGDFFNWISLITIHDLQIVGGTVEAPEASEEALLLITTGSTVWLLATQGRSMWWANSSNLRPISSFRKIFTVLRHLTRRLQVRHARHAVKRCRLGQNSVPNAVRRKRAHRKHKKRNRRQLRRVHPVAPVCVRGLSSAHNVVNRWEDPDD
jgi:hypothetical protein